jgi:hypothetical protein
MTSVVELASGLDITDWIIQDEIGCIKKYKWFDSSHESMVVKLKEGESAKLLERVKREMDIRQSALCYEEINEEP